MISRWRGDRHALLLAAGKLRRKVVEPLGQPDQRQGLARIERLVGDLVHQCDVFEHGEARDQIVELEHEADMLAPVARQLGLAGVDEIMVAPHSLAGGRCVEPAENIEQRRFAGAGWPQQHHEFAFVAKNGGGPAVLPPSPLEHISRPISRVL